MAQLINEVKRMQQLAGIINEFQLNEAEGVSVDKALDNSKVQAASEKLAQDPALLQKAIGELSKLGIDKNTLVKAAQAYNTGKPVDPIIKPEIEQASSEKLSEADLSGGWLGGILGGVVGVLPAFAGSTPTEGMAIFTLASVVIGALAGMYWSNKAEKSQQESVDIESTINEALAKVRQNKK